ncbi:MAG: hypothetical protein WCS99_13500 [Limisphaerales bacterium]
MRAFILPEKQDRWLALLAKPKRRSDITHSLAHSRDIDERWAIPIQSADQTAAGVSKLLATKRAPKLCYVISESGEMDGREMNLEEAIDAVLGMGLGAIVSCIPGRLAYYESEFRTRFFLERKQ